VPNRLIWAAKRGDQAALISPLQSCTDINCKDSQGWTPLFHAAHNGHTEAVRLLIQAGADVNEGIETGFTALYSAVLGQHVETVRVLIEAGARIAPVNGIELRGYALLAADAAKRYAILTMLDTEKSN
jgi:ankyrin repeat protein